MGGEWPTLPFKEVLCGGTRNGIYKKKEFHGSGVKIVNMGELFANSRLFSCPMKRVELTDSEKERFLLEPGDLLFARRSLVASGAGKCSIVMDADEPTTFESSIIRARPNQKAADSQYLYYLFSSPHGRHLLDTIRRQVAVAGITGTDLSQLEIPVPPLSDQHHIGEILGTLDDKIELNRQMNRTLEAMARAIFKAWFVDFEPVKAKAAGATSFCGMPQAVFDQLPDHFTDTDLGPVPEGWEVKSIDKIADFLNGIPLQKYPASEDEDSLPVIKIAELRNGISSNSGRASREVPRKYVVNDGDFLFSWSGSLLAKFWTEGEGALNQHLFKVTSETYPMWFVSQWVQHHLEAFQRIAASKATTMGHIQRRHLKEARVVCPQKHTLNEMSTLVSPLIEKMIGSEVESRTLAAIRDTLLPKLISGELRVPVAEETTDGD